MVGKKRIKLQKQRKYMKLGTESTVLTYQKYLGGSCGCLYKCRSVITNWTTEWNACI